MQGRLLSKYKDKYQAHPVGYWQNEFILAQQLGLDCIEFILDYDLWDCNPLMTTEGRKEILQISKNTGVKVKTICADYFMNAPLHSSDKDLREASKKVFDMLLSSAYEIGVKDIVLPCVDNSSLNDEVSCSSLSSSLDSLLPKAEALKVNICLETDLNPNNFYTFLEKFKSKRLTVNYDTGNSASLGYDIVEEFEAYGTRITDLHIKDRVFQGGSVFLGTGDVDFDKLFQQIIKYKFSGPIILQAYRDDEGFKIFNNQLSWFKQKFSEILCQ